MATSAFGIDRAKWSEPLRSKSQKIRYEEKSTKEFIWYQEEASNSNFNGVFSQKRSKTVFGLDLKLWPGLSKI